MEIIEKIFLENKDWANGKVQFDKLYFEKLSLMQEPDFLWIGCSDSRVPANVITNTEPGEMFVHRNIANVVDINDINLMSVVQYAVEYLKVKHIIVCGHYGCGGIKAALTNNSFGNMDVWLNKIKEIAKQHDIELALCKSEEEKAKKMVEFNVIAGVEKLKTVEIIKNSTIRLHGWVYDLHDGILNKLV